jgi:hypothetical protein
MKVDQVSVFEVAGECDRFADKLEIEDYEPFDIDVTRVVVFLVLPMKVSRVLARFGCQQSISSTHLHNLRLLS